MADAGAGRAELGRTLPPNPRRRRDRPLHGAAQRASSSRGGALHEGHRRVDARPISRMGLGGAHRNLRRAVPDAERTTARDDRADKIQGNARRTGGCRGSNLGPEGRAASDVQHLLHRRRCDRTAGLRELRPPRRLRRAGRARHLGPRRHRHCAVRRVFSRDEAKDRRRAWRHRLPDLLRSQRRRVLHGRGVSRRPHAQQGRRPARQRDGSADLLGRSAHSRYRGRSGSEATLDQRGGHDYEDTGPADFLRRRAAAARGDEWTDSALPPGGAPCRSRIGWAQGRRRCI